jgi:hypothetical protein
MTGDQGSMELAISLAGQCPPSKGAYSGGAVIDANRNELARGYSVRTTHTSTPRNQHYGNFPGRSPAGPCHDLLHPRTLLAAQVPPAPAHG